MANRAVFTFELVDRSAGGDGASAGGGSTTPGTGGDTRTPRTKQQDKGAAASGGPGAVPVAAVAVAESSRAIRAQRQSSALQAGALAISPLAGQAAARIGGAAGFGAAAGGLAGLAAAAGPVAAVAGGAALIAGVTVGTVAAARGLRDVSPDVARAAAFADAARIQADLGAAQRFGPRFAGVTAAQGGLSREFTELGRGIAGLASGEVEALLKLLTGLLSAVNAGVVVLDEIRQWLPPGPAALLVKLLEKLGAIDKNTKGKATDILTWWNDQEFIELPGTERQQGTPDDIVFGAPIPGLQLP